MPPASTGFSDKLWLLDPSPGPDKLQVLGGSSSQTGTQGELSNADRKRGFRAVLS